MTDHQAVFEGRATITETAQRTAELLRAQLVVSPSMDERVAGRHQRYSFVVGSLLAYVPDEVKLDLLGLLRDGSVYEVQND